MTTVDPRLLLTLRPRDSLGRAISGALPSVTWAYAQDTPPESWGAVEVLMVGALDRELPGFDASRTPRLSYVQRIYTGVDGFPFDRFPRTVKVAGNVGAYAPFVAEHALALALAAARVIPGSHERVRRGELRPPPEHRLLFGRTAVILGYGEIGQAIAQRLRGFEMRVVGVNRSGRMAPGCTAMYPAEALATAVGEGDFVFDARPLTRSTRGSVNAGVLSAMKPDAVFVNVGRAGTVDEEALYRHLVDHPTFRAALDVWWGEDFEHGRLSHRFPIADLPNAIGTPHAAGFGPGVESYVLAQALQNVARYFRGEPLRHVVDRSEYSDGASGR
jgi:phosphoglycerate dehydrogenase-like enzyme